MSAPRARVLGARAGLRPGRPAVRLETLHPAPGRTLIHDHGHGGAGCTLAGGCADEVAARARAATGLTRA